MCIRDSFYTISRTFKGHLVEGDARRRLDVFEGQLAGDAVGLDLIFDRVGDGRAALRGALHLERRLGRVVVADELRDI